MKQVRKVREAIVTLLKAGHGVDLWADLSVYPDKDTFVVECFLGDVPPDGQGLTEDQAEQLAEGELAEYLDSPEEAADLYLRLWDKYGKALPPPGKPAPPPGRGPRELARAPLVPAPDLHPACFDAEVLESPDPVLVLFWARWGGPDRAQLLVIEKLARDYQGIRFGKVDVDQFEELARRFAVDAVPASLLFRGGRVINRLEGFQTEQALRKALDALEG